MTERRKAVIADVDGTLVDVRSVRHHVMDHPKDFHKFHSGALECPPVESTLQWVTEQHELGHEILVVTARMSMWFDGTHDWLQRHMPVPYTGPMMRQNKDYWRDVEIKAEILDQLSIWYDFVGAIDDNPAIVELWESRGIPTTVVPGWGFFE